MRSTFAIAALAAGVVAAPYKRDVIVTDVDVVYATEVVTVYATAGETTTAAAEPTTTTEVQWNGHHWSHGGWNWGSPKETTETLTYVAPTTPSTTETPTSTYVPPPPPTTTPTSTYVAPVTTEEAAEPITWVKATSSAAAPATPTDYQSTVVYHHNVHRANHSAPDVEWSDDLATSAGIVAATCIWAHKMDVNGGGYGQNIAAGMEPEKVAYHITDQFYNGEAPAYADMYGLLNPLNGTFDNIGHFTQLVWKDTTHVACATQHCPGGVAGLNQVGPYFTVCNYKTPGNWEDQYGDNVGKPLGHAEVTAEDTSAW